jgi:hypothetical protein
MNIIANFADSGTLKANVNDTLYDDMKGQEFYV